MISVYQWRRYSFDVRGLVLIMPLSLALIHVLIFLLSIFSLSTQILLHCFAESSVVGIDIQMLIGKEQILNISVWGRKNFQLLPGEAIEYSRKDVMVRIWPILSKACFNMSYISSMDLFNFPSLSFLIHKRQVLMQVVKAYWSASQELPDILLIVAALWPNWREHLRYTQTIW